MNRTPAMENDQDISYSAGSQDAPRSLRVCILAHSCRVAGGLSVGRNLTAALGRVAPQHDYMVTIPAGLGYEEICSHILRCEPIVYEHRGGLIGRWFYETFTLPRIVRAFGPDVVLSLDSRGLTNPPCPQTVFCDDPHLYYPARHYARETRRSRLLNLYKRRSFRRQLRNTQVLLCPTPVAEARLRQTYRYRGMVALSPNALSTVFLAGDAQAKMPQALRPYADRTKLFYLTRFYAHKNLEALVELFGRYGPELEGTIAVLTVSPDQHPNASKFLKSIRRRGLADRIINVGPLSQAEAAGYLRHCQALLMPTLLESFGLPYLEAMHFGLPILTSDLDFAHHICGDAALYFDPWDIRSIKDTILRLKKTPGLVDELVERGKRRLRDHFPSWDEVATNLAGLLYDLAD